MSHLSDEADLLVADLHALIGDAATECMNIVRLGWGDGAAGRLALERFEDLMFNVNRIAEKLIAIEKARIGEEPANSRIAAACGQRDCIRPRWDGSPEGLCMECYDACHVVPSREPR